MTYKTPLENFVEGFLRTHNRKTVPKKFVEKAIVLIETKLDSPCCTDPDAVIDLKTGERSILTDTVKQFLNGMNKAGNTRSLTRTKKLLEAFIGIPCCE